MIASFAASILVGCSPGDTRNSGNIQTTYMYNVAATGWKTELEINGQPCPTNSDGWMIMADVTHFVVDGVNTARIVADRVAGTDRDGVCDIRFVAVSSSTDPNAVETVDGIFEETDAGDYFEREFTFSATMPIRWRWQDADDVGKLTETDRAEMLTLMESIAAAYRSRRVDSIREACLPWWPGDNQLLVRGARMEEVGAEQAQAVFAASDYQVSVTRSEDLEFQAGSKLVRLASTALIPPIAGEFPPTRARIIHAGPAAPSTRPSGQVEYSLCVPELFFIKQNGEWQALAW